MFDDRILSEPDLILEVENPVRFKHISGEDNIFFNNIKTEERRVRTYIYDLLKEARKHLPENYHFVIYEAYRPLARQVEMWENLKSRLMKENPHLDPESEELAEMCNVYIANPYRQGSGHQSGAAVDVSLVNDNEVEYDMGCAVGDFGPETAIDSEHISEEAKKNRSILKSALEKVGLINYPPEWWHYSFGDRLWARMTGSKLAVFANIKE